MRVCVSTRERVHARIPPHCLIHGQSSWSVCSCKYASSGFPFHVASRHTTQLTQLVVSLLNTVQLTLLPAHSSHCGSPVTCSHQNQLRHVVCVMSLESSSPRCGLKIISSKEISQGRVGRGGSRQPKGQMKIRGETVHEGTPAGTRNCTKASLSREPCAQPHTLHAYLGRHDTCW